MFSVAKFFFATPTVQTRLLAHVEEGVGFKMALDPAPILVRKAHSNFIPDQEDNETRTHVKRRYVQLVVGIREKDEVIVQGATIFLVLRR